MSERPTLPGAEDGAGQAGPDARRRLAALARRVNRYSEQPLPATGLFLVFVVAWYMNWGARRGIFAAMRFEFTVGWLLLLACVGLVITRKLDISRSRALLLATAGLLLVMVIQIPFAADPRSAKFIFFDRGVFKFAMMGFFIMVMVQSPRTLLWFLLAFLLACLYVTQESVQGLISGGLYWENQGVMRLHGSVRMYAHPNSLAGLAMGVIPFVIFLFPAVRSRVIRLGLLAVFGTSLICVVYSGSRTSYVAIIAFILFWWLVSRHKIRFLMIAFLVLLVLVPVVPQQYRDRFRSITGQETEGHSKGARIQILEDAVDIFLAHPGGVGLASFPAVRMRTFGREQDTHNLYLEVATNLGVQGLAAFIVFITLLFRGNYRAFRFFERRAAVCRPYLGRRGLSPPLRRALAQHLSDLRFLMAVNKAVAGFIFVRLMLGLFGMDMYEIYWWFAVGLTLALLNMMGAVAARSQQLVGLLDRDLAATP